MQVDRNTIAGCACAMLIALVVVAGAATAHAAEKPKAVAKQSSASQPVFDTTGIEKAIRESVKEAGEKAEARSAEEGTEYWTILGHKLKITDSVLALFTLILVIIGWWQGKQLKATVDVTRDEYIASHRPRMRIKHVWLERMLSSDEPVKINVITVNNGDSVAKVLRFDCVVHFVPAGRYAPNKPFEGRSPRTPMVDLESGLSLDHGSVDAGMLSLTQIDTIRRGDAKLYCFAYVDYLDQSKTPFLRKTSCCRIFRPDIGGGLSTFGGAFAKLEEESEHEYAD